MMHRLLHILVAVLFVNALLAGCFGDDGDTKGKTPTPTPTGDGNETGENNTTKDPFAGAKRAPIPSIKVTMQQGNDTIQGPPFLVDFGTNVTVTFDASNSTDPDGTIEAVSWTISSATGFSGTSSNLTFVADFGEMKSAMFGVYQITLKLLDNDNILNVTTAYFAIDYHNVFTLEDGMIGQGSADRNQPNEQKVSKLPGTEVPTGTFELHQLTVGRNATAINLSLAYTPGPATTMALYLFDPSVQTTEATNTEEPAASAPAAASPVPLTHTGNITSGAWKVRAELVGARVEGYTIDVVVTYATPVVPGIDLSG